MRGWLTPKPDPEFATKCADICTVYHDAPAAAQQDIRTVSIDEMTGVQALERAAPDLPMQPGKVARREFEYIRHGTQTLIAAFDVVSGTVVGTVGDSRTEQDYLSFLQSVFAVGTATTKWRVVADNLNTHVSEGVVRLVADLCGINQDLGEKGKSGVLASMAS
ncbi:MAG: transposase, partial [Rhodopila sp.]